MRCSRRRFFVVAQRQILLITFVYTSFRRFIEFGNVDISNVWMISQLKGQLYQTSSCLSDFFLLKVFSLISPSLARPISSSISSASFTRSRTFKDKETPSRSARRSTLLYKDFSRTTLILGFFVGIEIHLLSATLMIHHFSLFFHSLFPKCIGR